MRRELETMRHWAESRLRAGAVPDESWQHHVQLIEALDAVLHDIAVAEGASRTSLRIAAPDIQQVAVQQAANDARPRASARQLTILRRTGAPT